MAITIRSGYGSRLDRDRLGEPQETDIYSPCGGLMYSLRVDVKLFLKEEGKKGKNQQVKREVALHIGESSFSDLPYHCEVLPLWNSRLPLLWESWVLYSPSHLQAFTFSRYSAEEPRYVITIYYTVYINYGWFSPLSYTY